jgi:hypothetical protein
MDTTHSHPDADHSWRGPAWGTEAFVENLLSSTCGIASASCSPTTLFWAAIG